MIRKLFLLMTVSLHCLYSAKSIANEPVVQSLSYVPKVLISNEPHSVTGKRLIDDVDVFAMVPLSNGRVLFTSSGPYFQFRESTGEQAYDVRKVASDFECREQVSRVVRSFHMGFELKGTKKQIVNPVLSEPSVTKVSFFLGGPENWRPDIPTFQRVTYNEVWDGVTLTYFSDGPQWRYQFVCESLQALERIKMETGGAEVTTNPEGMLVSRTGGHTMIVGKPTAWRTESGGEVNLSVSFRLFKNGRYGIDVIGPAPLGQIVVSGTWGTYLGGSGLEQITGVAVGPGGNVFVGGITDSLDYPVTPNAFDTSYHGDSDLFVTQLNSSGTEIIYSTYLGGNKFDGHSDIAVDDEGNAFVTGYTFSDDFPTTPGAYQTAYSGSFDCFVTKFNSAGTELAFSTYIGGQGADQAWAIALDESSNVYLAGETAEPGLPTTPGAFDQSYNGGNRDGFVTILSADGSNLIASTLIGGAQGDYFNDLVRDELGDLYVAGWSRSDGFPTTPGVIGPNLSISPDGIVVKFNSTLTALEFSTFLGGSHMDGALGIECDSSHNVFVLGNTASEDFPVTVDAFQSYLQGWDDLSLTKLSPDGTNLIYSTFLGGGSLEHAWRMVSDVAGNLYLLGDSLGGYPVSTDAFDTTYNGGGDAVVTKFTSSGQIRYSTYVGGSGEELPRDIAVDGKGNFYTVGRTASSNFPVSPGAYDVTLGGFNDGYLIKICTPPGFYYYPESATVCVGDPVSFSSDGVGTGPITYRWLKDGEYIVGADASTYTIPSVALSDTGSYVCEITDACSAQSGAAELTVAVEPVITAHPTPLTRCVDDTALFSAEASSLISISYQWRKDLVDIPGAIESELLLPSVSLADAGNYSCEITNDCGSVVTSIATLTVLDEEPVSIVVQPTDLVVCVGADVDLSVTAAGTGPLTYQWFKNGTLIPFATVPTLSLLDVTGADEGSYRCDVTNSCGSISTSSAAIDVTLGVWANPMSVAQGLVPLSLDGGWTCPISPIDIQWENLTSGFLFDLNENPVIIDPLPTETSTFEVTLTEPTSQFIETDQVTLLFGTTLDWNNDGCNDTNDLLEALPFWDMPYLLDLNGDQWMDVRDFLYINIFSGCL